MESTSYYISIDQSTTGTMVQLFNSEGNSVAQSRKDHKQITPQPGWLEHDFKEVYSNLVELIQGLQSEVGFAAGQIRGIGITNQRETVVAWRKSTGELLYNAVVWCDVRTAGVADRIRQESGNNPDAYKELTGLPISTYFTGFKIRWLIENVEEVAKAYEEEDILFGNVNTYLIWRMTCSSSFVTDPSNASRTFLMNLKTISYDPELLKLFGLRESCLPEIRPNFCELGIVSDESLGLNGVRILSSIGDQQSSALALSSPLKTTYGTGCFMIGSTGEQAVTNAEGLIATVLWMTEDKKVTYGLEAAIECGGSTINWLRDRLNLFEDFGEMEKSVSELKDNGGVWFVPSFAGLYSPFWEDNAKSVLMGLTANSSKASIIRACLEGIAYRVKDCIEQMKKYSPESLTNMVVDGGLTNNKFFLSLQQSVLDQSIQIGN